MKSARTALLSLAILFAFGAGAWSVHGQAVRTDYMETELVVETTSVKPGQPFWAGLWMKMDEHWHTYWRNPADSGLPTKIHWTLPEGFRAGEINWPYPQKIELDILASYGYEGETLLLVEFTPPADLVTRRDGRRRGLRLLAGLCGYLPPGRIRIPGDAARFHGRAPGR